MFKTFKLATLGLAAATLTFAGMPNANAAGMLGTGELTSSQALLAGETSEGTLTARRVIYVRRRRIRVRRRRRVRRVRRRYCYRRYYRRYGRRYWRRVCRVRVRYIRY